ncbi:MULTISPECIES: hypothetical protein [Pseudomonas]|jgi:hypothetical protein|uniref:Uncharacterized protein n=1 Tax=Pseudomonas brassicacearum (strain NFM421) TaxID=994484 RepID=F2K9R8_PSEBN|nr:MULTISPECIES: hypothetical protein [Pseudomonas]EIK64096.1 hypothetical protein PflQ8_2044 [Pseudomonas fluorescens Q8r1-96]KIR18197.1 hypothetical protein PFLU4_10950 [Pseudomonas fluorescens]AEA68130.1 Hypothetical protein PSEBR_a1909 [Pseudomonas brassicacearum subsp. brassicacearum NFM421]ALQ02794.1 hypothetical protein AK973_2345 [Pseudomonas brassicacearum]AOS38336.1 hypothetical protein A0U95_06085 [Pseudomonas brassicacearum]
MKQTIGEVRAINRPRAMVGVYVGQEHGHTVLALRSANDIDIGDILEWDSGTALGTQSYHNQTKGWTADVYVANHGVATANLEVQLMVGSS